MVHNGDKCSTNVAFQMRMITTFMEDIDVLLPMNSSFLFSDREWTAKVYEKQREKEGGRSRYVEECIMEHINGCIMLSLNAGSSTVDGEVKVNFFKE